MGEKSGHPFRGNQWTDGSGGGGPKGFPADDEVRDGMMDVDGVPGDLVRDILDDEQREIDDATSSALYDYVARGDYVKMNSELRRNPRGMNRFLEGPEPDNEGQLRDMHRIQQTLKELLPNKAIVYRGANLPPKAEAKLDTPGAEIRLAGFLSTSLDPATATGFNMSRILEIRAKQGRLLKESAESEVLLPHGSKFKVVGRKKVKMRVNPGRMYETSKQPIEEVEIIQLEQITI